MSTPQPHPLPPPLAKERGKFELPLASTLERGKG